MNILVTGGVRSGKSRHAEALLAAAPSVTYVAPGPTVDEDPDPDWAARIAAHQRQRPATWTTVETRDLARALAIDGPVLVDCLGTWLTDIVDAAGLWEHRAGATEAVDHARDELVAALRLAAGPIVLVSNEVGLGVVPAHASGRLFRDLLGRLNAGVADACEHVALVVAGRVLDLSGAPTVAQATTHGL